MEETNRNEAMVVMSKEQLEALVEATVIKAMASQMESIVDQVAEITSGRTLLALAEIFEHAATNLRYIVLGDEGLKAIASTKDESALEEAVDMVVESGRYEVYDLDPDEEDDDGRPQLTLVKGGRKDDSKETDSETEERKVVERHELDGKKLVSPAPDGEA